MRTFVREQARQSRAIKRVLQHIAAGRIVSIGGDHNLSSWVEHLTRRRAVHAAAIREFRSYA